MCMFCTVYCDIQIRHYDFRMLWIYKKHKLWIGGWVDGPYQVFFLICEENPITTYAVNRHTSAK